MNTTVTAIHSEDNPYLISSPNIITDAGDSFLELTGYSKDELVNKDISEVLTNLLRLPAEAYKQIEMNGNTEGYLFTKNLEVKEVVIYIFQGQDAVRKTYYIKEKPNSRLDDKLIFIQHLFKDNLTGVNVFSVPDMILLKSNQKYLDFLDTPYNIMENSIGKPIWEIITGYKGSQSEANRNKVIQTQSPFQVKEYKYDNLSRGITYWDSTLTPVFENGKLKYIFENVTEVTERVLDRQYKNKLLDFSNEAIFAWKLDGAITYWNKGAEKMYGFNREEAIGCVSCDLLKTVYLSKIDNIKSILARDGVWDGEIEHTTKDGRKLVIETRHQVIINEFGKKIVLESNRDITERKMMEEDIRIANQLNNEILESFNHGLFFLDKEWCFTYVNQQAARSFGFEPHDILNLNIWDKFPHIKGTVIERNFRQVMQEQQSVQFKLLGILKDRHYQYSVYPSYSGITVYMVDITERLLTEMQLDEARSLSQSQALRLDAILENMTEGVIVADAKGNMVSMNTAALRMHGLNSLEGFVHFEDFGIVFEIFSLDGRPMPPEEWAMGRALRGEVFTDYEIWVCRKDIDLKWIGSYGGTPIYDKNGEMVMGIITLRDVTELKKQQELLLKAQEGKNKALEQIIEMKDEFLSLISHEFKTPLTVINSAIQAMEFICKDELSDKVKGFLSKIKQNSNRQLKLVNNLLDITRANSGHITINKKDSDIVLLTRLITESITIFAEQKGVKLSFSSTLGKKVIGIDEEKYERILLNLLSNAVKFTPEGRSISVKVSQRLVKRKCKVCIQVIDRGIGIPDDKKELIFEKFGQVDSSLTRQAEGTGIGLHLVKLFVEMMGGEITLESRAGKGCTFTILLPVDKVNDTPIEQMIKEISDNRLIKATVIEFSDIYL